MKQPKFSEEQMRRATRQAKPVLRWATVADSLEWVTRPSMRGERSMPTGRD